MQFIKQHILALAFTAFTFLIASVSFIWSGYEASMKSVRELARTNAESALIKHVMFRGAELYEVWWSKNNGSYAGFIETNENSDRMSELVDAAKANDLDAYYYTLKC